jgi:hypothetical protein
LPGGSALQMPNYLGRLDAVVGLLGETIQEKKVLLFSTADSAGELVVSLKQI